MHLHLDVVPEVLLYYCLKLIYKEKKFSTTIFFVEHHLDVVLKDPLVVGEKSLFYKTCR